MEGEEWGDMVQKLDKINALLKPYREDPIMSKSALILSLEKAALELERNACTIHDMQRWQSAAANQPKSKLHEVRSKEMFSSYDPMCIVRSCCTPSITQVYLFFSKRLWWIELLRNSLLWIRESPR